MTIHRIVKIKIAQLSQYQLNQWYLLLTSTEVNYQREFFDELVQLTHYAYFNYNEEKQLIGACAVSYLPTDINNKQVLIIKTNLVCIDKNYRGGRFIRTAGWMSIRYARKNYDAMPLYWASVLLSPIAYLLIAKTFSQYYPHPQKPTPQAIQTIMKFISHGNFKTDYANNIFDGSGKQSITHFETDADSSELTKKIIQYFNSINPEYTKGSAFTCVVPLNLTNKISLGLKGLKKLLLKNNASGVQHDLPSLQKSK